MMSIGSILQTKIPSLMGHGIGITGRCGRPSISSINKAKGLQLAD